MGYIREPGHLINYINKFIRESGHAYEDLPLKEEVIHYIWDMGLADRFTWVLSREDHTVIEREKMIGFFAAEAERDRAKIREELHDRLKTSALKKHERDKYRYTSKFVDALIKLEGFPGVYSFWNNRKDTPLYVGVSKNLGQRVSSSLNERIRDVKDASNVYLRYIIAKTKSDACFLEIYFIAKLKPTLNSTSSYDDEITYKINAPKFSNRIKCLEVKK